MFSVFATSFSFSQICAIVSRPSKTRSVCCWLKILWLQLKFFLNIQAFSETHRNFSGDVNRSSDLIFFASIRQVKIEEGIVVGVQS